MSKSEKVHPVTARDAPEAWRREAETIKSAAHAGQHLELLKGHRVWKDKAGYIFASRGKAVPSKSDRVVAYLAGRGFCAGKLGDVHRAATEEMKVTTAVNPPGVVHPARENPPACTCKHNPPPPPGDNRNLRHVRLDGYELRTWDTYRTDGRGKSILGYQLKGPDGRVLFEGEDFGNSPMNAVDSDDTLRALLGFLTLKPGDTDAEYFANYTPEQMAFARGPAEQLQMYAEEEGGWPFENLDDWSSENPPPHHPRPHHVRAGQRNARIVIVPVEPNPTLPQFYTIEVTKDGGGAWFGYVIEGGKRMSNLLSFPKSAWKEAGPGYGEENPRGKTRLDMLQESLPPGYTVRTYSPGDGMTRYRFFHNAPANQSYFGPDNGIYTALGMGEAEHFAAGLRSSPNPPARAPADDTAADELVIYADNEGALYNQKKSIIENLSKKMAKGTYDPALAPKLWLYWTSAAAERYTREFGTPGPHGKYGVFSPATRELAAREIAVREEAAIRSGEYRR